MATIVAVLVAGNLLQRARARLGTLTHQLPVRGAPCTMIGDTWYKYWVRVLYYGISAKLTYRIPVPRTRNEPKSATVARARVPPYFRRRYGGRRVPPRRLRRGDKGVRMRREGTPRVTRT